MRVQAESDSRDKRQGEIRADGGGGFERRLRGGPSLVTHATTHLALRQV